MWRWLKQTSQAAITHVTAQCRLMSRQLTLLWREPWPMSGGSGWSIVSRCETDWLQAVVECCRTCPVCRENILSTAASLLACGIDCQRSILFQQSAVCSPVNHSSSHYWSIVSWAFVHPSHLLLSSVHILLRLPFPQIDIIGAMVIVWRVRGKIIGSILCNIVCNNCAQWTAHTYEQTNSSLDWVLSHSAHFTLLRFIFVYVLLHVCVVF